MSAAPHLVAAVASHGWGHLSQTIPIVAALRARVPGLRTTVRTGLPAPLVRARFAAAGLPAPGVAPDDVEFGFTMRDALTVDGAASLARYRGLLAERHERLAREVDALRALRADLVLANVGWLPIAAGAALGLPAFGACSLNWADLVAARWPDDADAAAVVDWMVAGYDRADALFALEPGMPFERFANRVRVPPVVKPPVPGRRDALRAALGVERDARVAMLAFGGLPLHVDTTAWRLPEGVAAVVMAEGGTDASRVRTGASLGWSYADVLASCDLLVAKPGYGTFAEAGFAARDTAYVPRDDWPEAPHLVDWLARHARVARVSLEAVRAGRFDAALAEIDAQPARRSATGDGAAVIADAIGARLGVAPVSPP
ncbi:MAG: hypothetical protein RJA99_2098 [Pseudomonadota bacterium]